jgi:putative intracellular protease/amidase
LYSHPTISWEILASHLDGTWYVSLIFLWIILRKLQPELVHPYEILAPYVQIVIASPNGGEAPLDPGSVDASKDDAQSQNFFINKSALWKNTQTLSSLLGHANEFEAIFFVGGHGRQFLIITSCFILLQLILK